MQKSDLNFSLSGAGLTWRALLLIAAIQECCWHPSIILKVNAFASVRHRHFHPFGKLVASSRSAPFPFPLFSRNDGVSVLSSSREELILSEADAIKILRASPRLKKENVNDNRAEIGRGQPCSLTECTSASEVIQVLKLVSHDGSSDGVQQIVDATSPNVAAAALRRLLSPPFLSSSFVTTKKGVQYITKRPMQQCEISESEKNLYVQLTTLLQKRLSDCMCNQWQSLLNLELNADSVPVLLHKNSTLANPPASKKNPQPSQLNWYALADLLFTGSVLSNLQLYLRKRQKNTSKNVYLQGIVESQSEQNKYASESVDTLIKYLSFSNEITSSFVRIIGPRRLVRDVLVPIAAIKAVRQQVKVADSSAYESDMDDSLDFWSDDLVEIEDDVFEDVHFISFNMNINHIIQVLSSYLSLSHSLEALNCSDLSMTLWCLAQIYSGAKSDNLGWSDELRNSLQIGDVQLELIRAFMKRLRKVSVHSMGSGRSISQALWSADRLVGLIEQQKLADQFDQPWDMDGIADDIFLPGEVGPKISEDEVKGCVLNSNGNKNESSRVLEEAVIMFYTLTKELLKTSNSSSTYCKLNSLSFDQLADVLQASISLNIPRSDLTMLSESAIDVLTRNDPTSVSLISQCNSCAQLARMLWAFHRMRIGNTTSALVQLLGERCLALVQDLNQQCTPKTIVTALRSSVMMCPGQTQSTDAILRAASLLILDDSRPDVTDPPFLIKCNEYEVSNLLLAFALARRFDEDIFLHLTAQMLEADVLDTCTGSSASRAMWSCAVLLQQRSSGNDDESFLYERQIDLYHQLSGALLSSSLGPSDCSCAMWAMAKSSFALDKGCFDILAQKLSEMLKTSNVNTRLVVQAVWSCGKMARFENNRSIGCDATDSQPPPYMESVTVFLSYLIDNGDEMTPPQISQVIWALGSLRFSDACITKELSNIVVRMVSDPVMAFNSQEIANMAWGFSKICCEGDVVLSLVRHVTESSRLCEECTSQEASNMLYSLGKLALKDHDAFESLSAILMSQLNAASSQAIANALWAFDAVELEPPIELMGSWAKEKLGMEDVA